MDKNIGVRIIKRKNDQGEETQWKGTRTFCVVTLSLGLFQTR